MRLSIITPTLNSREHLGKTIQSVLDQSFEDLEHLIIDGGSTDGTLNLLEKYTHLKVITGPDEGVFDAMNKGIAAASGEWLYFIGADDYFVDNKVVQDLAPLFATDLDIFYGDIWSARLGERYDGPFDFRKIRRKNINHQSIFFRRRVFEKIGAFNTEYLSYADWDHNMRWMLNSEFRAKYVDRVIAVYGGSGFSFTNPDALFRKDRLYRYLLYGKGELPILIFVALLGKELLLAMRSLDWVRIKRAISIIFSSRPATAQG